MGPRAAAPEASPPVWVRPPRSPAAPGLRSGPLWSWWTRVHRQTPKPEA